MQMETIWYLHGGSIGDQVHELAVGDDTTCDVVRLVVRVEDGFHLRPEGLLPLEDCLLRDNIGHDLGLETTAEEVVGEVFDVVQGVVVGHDDVFVIFQHAIVTEGGRRTVIRKEGCDHTTLAYGLPACGVFTADSMTLRRENSVRQKKDGRRVRNRPLKGKGFYKSISIKIPACLFAYLEEHRTVEAELDTFDVDSVTRDGDTIPTTTHRTVGRAPALLQPHGLDLCRRGSDRRFLEDGADALASIDGVLQDFVISFIASATRKIEELPIGGVEVRLNPLIQAERNILG